jgi:nitrate/nitrite-specific signal transduction histidine kinase
MVPQSLDAGKVAELVDAAASVVEAGDLKQALEALVDTAMEVTGARYGALGVLGDHGQLGAFIHRGVPEATAAAIGVPPAGRGVLGTITREQKWLRLDDVASHPDAVGFPEHHPHMESFLGGPVQVGGTVFGNLYLANKPGGFVDEDVALVAALAKIGGAAVSTNRLQQRLRTAAVIEDRERIARDLHDAIIQDLFAVGLRLQADTSLMEDAELRASVEESIESLDAAMGSLRQFIFQLRPPAWDHQRLTERIRATLAELSEAHGFPIAVAFEGELDELPPGIGDEVVATITEAASNALRHSEASEIRIDVTNVAGALSVAVSDDGVGFDLGAVELGMGLVNLQGRAKDLAGELTIETRPGSGTRVEMKFPV